MGELKQAPFRLFMSIIPSFSSHLTSFIHAATRIRDTLCSVMSKLSYAVAIFDTIFKQQGLRSMNRSLLIS